MVGALPNSLGPSDLAMLLSARVRIGGVGSLPQAARFAAPTSELSSSLYSIASPVGGGVARIPPLSGGTPVPTESPEHRRMVCSSGGLKEPTSTGTYCSIHHAINFTHLQIASF